MTLPVLEDHDPTYGVRPLRRVVRWQVENTISKRLLAGEFAEGDTVRVDHTAHGYRFTKAQVEAAVA